MEKVRRRYEQRIIEESAEPLLRALITRPIRGSINTLPPLILATVVREGRAQFAVHFSQPPAVPVTIEILIYPLIFDDTDILESAFVAVLPTTTVPPISCTEMVTGDSVPAAICSWELSPDNTSQGARAAQHGGLHCARDSAVGECRLNLRLDIAGATLPDSDAAITLQIVEASEYSLPRPLILQVLDAGDEAENLLIEFLTANLPSSLAEGESALATLIAPFAPTAETIITISISSTSAATFGTDFHLLNSATVPLAAIVGANANLREIILLQNSLFAEFIITASADGDVEAAESFTLSIIEGRSTTATTYGLGTISVFADSIDNAPYGIVFESPNDIVFGVEGDSIEVTVIGSGVTITGGLTVSFAILDGETIANLGGAESTPATYDDDFTSSACTSQSSCQVIVGATVTQAILPFTVFADNPPPEGQENFRIALRPGDGYELPQTQSTITVNITEVPFLRTNLAEEDASPFWDSVIEVPYQFVPPLTAAFTISVQANGLTASTAFDSIPADICADAANPVCAVTVSSGVSQAMLTLTLSLPSAGNALTLSITVSSFEYPGPPRTTLIVRNPAVTLTILRPQINFVGGNASADEGVNQEITVRRTATPGSGISLFIAVENLGGATNADYNLIFDPAFVAESDTCGVGECRRILWPDAASQVIFTLSVSADVADDNGESVRLALVSSLNEAEGYAPGDPDEIVVTFGDVAPVVSLSVTTPLTQEGGVGEYAFNINRRQATNIRFQISGNDLTADEIAILNATNATISNCVPNDESASILAACTISLPGDADSVVVRLSARIDARLENTETWTLQLLTNPGEHYTVAPSENRIVSNIANTRFEAGFSEAAASVREGTSYTVNITADIALLDDDSFNITLNRSFPTGPSTATQADITTYEGTECNVASNVCIRTITGTVALGAVIPVLTISIFDDGDGDAGEIVRFSLADATSPFTVTAAAATLDLTITETPEIGFSTAGPIDVLWGQDDLVMSVVLSPPLSENATGNLPFNFLATGFANDWVQEVDTGTDLDCVSVPNSCVLTNPDERRSPIEATVRFTPEAAVVPGPRVVMVSLADAYLDAVNAIPGDDYIWVNQTLTVNIINPIIRRTTAEEIEIREGESANVIFTRFPIIGDGNDFTVGVGFPNVNGASAADIAAINVNEADADCILTPPISCTGDFGGGVGDLVVSISIAADVGAAEADERIVLTLLAQNAHDVDPAAFLATVIIRDVPPVIGLSQANPPNRLTAEGDTGIYTFAIDRQRATPTQISFQISGNDLTADEIIILPETGTTPIPDSDCDAALENIDCVISLPGNADSVVVRLSARIDARLENTETWTLQLLTNPGQHYTVDPSENRIVSDITNTRFQAGFREAAASVREGSSYIVNITTTIALLRDDSFDITLRRSFSAGASSDDITYDEGIECDVNGDRCIRTINGPVALGDPISVLIVTAVAETPELPDADEIVSFTLLDATSPFTAVPDSFDLTITERSEVGFSTGGPINVLWGDADSAPDGNLILTIQISPPLASPPLNANPTGPNLSVVADNVAPSWRTPIGSGLNCGNSQANQICQSNADERNQQFLLATLRLNQQAAIVPSPNTVTVLLRDDYINAINDAISGDDEYTYENQELIVNIINPIIARTTPSPINVDEGQSANVIFTRNPVIGDGSGFVVGVGFEGSASAADIAAINVNEADADCTLTPPITCTGDFGSGVGDLTVSISIAEDFELASDEVDERIVLNLQAQNAHDVDPATGLPAAGLLATVIIGNVDPLVGFSAVLPTTPIFWGQPISLSVTVSPPSPSALSVSVRVTGPGSASSLLPPANPDNNDPQCVQAASGYFCHIGNLVTGNASPTSANENPLQANPVGGYVLSLTLNQNSIPGNNYAADANADAVTISISRYAVTLSVANTLPGGFQVGEEGVIQILDNNAEASGIPAWADGDFSVAISVSGGEEGTDWVMHPLPENAAGVAQGLPIADCDTNCDIAWTDTTNGANAYLRILQRTGATLSVYLLDEARSGDDAGGDFCYCLYDCIADCGVFRQ